MEINPIKITIRDLVEGYKDNSEEGVKAYGGKLDVRPPYQREFIYKDKQRDAVVQTVLDKYPLNVMYWADRGDGTFEIIDGQQRTISICQYVTGTFSYMFLKFENLTPEEQNKILDYELMIYVCKGDSKEKLKWFETINIAGEELTPQELKNAVYSGSFVTDAKRYFSKSGCPAYNIGKNIVSSKAKPSRQEYLEIALKWLCYSKGINDIRVYMDNHRNDATALELWNYYNNVINWVESLFYVVKRKNQIQGLDWGKLYEKYHNDTTLNKDVLDARIEELLKDDEVENKRGIVPYLFDGDEKHLSLRTFPNKIKEAVYAEQKGICPMCGKHFELDEMEADHIKAWSKGGETTKDNCQMLCIHCNRTKSSK